MTLGTRESPDRSHSTWRDAKLSWAGVPAVWQSMGLQPTGRQQRMGDLGVYLATTSSWTRSKASLTTLERGLAKVTQALVFRSSDCCSSLP